MSMRHLAALAVLTSAAVHLILWFQGMRDVHVIGPSFLVNVAAGVAVAALLLRWRHWLAGALAAGFGAGTLGAFTMVSTVGLFGDHEKWQGPYVFTAAAAELVAIVAGLAVVRSEIGATAQVQLQSVGAEKRAESA
jgi:fluoride ion exporter CrcB/FEX